MLAHVTSDPPLGRPTVVGPSKQPLASNTEYQVTFHVLLLTSTAQSDYQVEVWHNHSDEHTWTSLALQKGDDNTSDCPDAFLCNSMINEPRVGWYKGTLKGYPKGQRGRTTARFTVRFKPRRGFAKDDCWKWATDLTGAGDGVLLYQPPGLHVPYEALTDFLSLPKQEHISVLPRASETPYTRLWLVTGHDVPPADSNDFSGRAKLSLGQVLDYERWISLTRESTPWLAPRHGQQELADGQSILYSFLRSDGLHVVVMAVSAIEADGDVQSVLCRDESRKALQLVARNDEIAPGKARAVISVGRSFSSAIAAAMYESRKLVKSFAPPEAAFRAGSSGTSPVTLASSNTAEPVKSTWYEEWLDGLGFCTWNSMGLEVNEDRLIHALDHLSEKGVQVSNVIIDDGWQSVDKPGESNMRQAWTSFEANPKKFPNGLAHTVRNIRTKHGSVKHVAVWHALMGYWSGISPNGELAKRFRTREVAIEKKAIFSDGKMTVVDGDDVGKLFEGFNTFLEDAGIDAVKTDVQFAPDEFVHAKDRCNLTSEYSRTWLNACLRYFAGRGIGCMAQTPSSLFSLLAYNYGPELPLRNSEDYFPYAEESHPWHIFCNAHNSLFTSFLNVVPDWDMFQTDHPWAEWHAAARCVSGGPIWITDKPGKCNVDVIRSITAPTPRGCTNVLRPTVVGRAGSPHNGYESDMLLRVSAYNGSAALGGTSIWGLFNTKPAPVSEVIKFNDWMGIEDDLEYVARSYRSGRTSRATHGSGVLGIGLSGHDWDIVTACPIMKLNSPSGSVQVASFGLTTHYTGSVALLSAACDLRPPSTSDNNVHRVHVTNTLKALGTASIWLSASQLPSKVDQLLVLVNGQASPPHCISIDHLDNSIPHLPRCTVNIDLEHAWEELDLRSDASNEVKLELLAPV